MKLCLCLQPNGHIIVILDTSNGPRSFDLTITKCDHQFHFNRHHKLHINPFQRLEMFRYIIIFASEMVGLVNQALLVNRESFEDSTEPVVQSAMCTSKCSKTLPLPLSLPLPLHVSHFTLCVRVLHDAGGFAVLLSQFSLVSSSLATSSMAFHGASSSSSSSSSSLSCLNGITVYS